MFLLVFLPSTSRAATTTYTWTGASGTTWETSTNWGGVTPPNSYSANTIVLSFNASPTSGNGTTNPIVLNTAYLLGTVNELFFSGNAFTGSSGYTISGSGSTGLGSPIYSIQSTMQGTGITETLGAPLLGGAYTNSGTKYLNITLDNYTPTSANTAYIRSGESGSNDTLAVTGPIIFSDSIDTHTFTLSLNGGGNGKISGGIEETGGANVGLAMESSATWTLSGDDSGITGATTLTGGGTLVLDYSTDAADAKLGTGAPLTFGATDGAGGVVLKMVGNTSGNPTGETPTSIIIDPGASQIVITSTTSSTQLYDTGNWSTSADRVVGGTMDFNLTTTGAGTSNVFLPTATNTSGIFGAWATFGGGATWATISGSGASAQVAGLANGSYTGDTWSTGNNTDVLTESYAVANGATTNSLRFNSATAVDLGLSTGDVITSGGILMTPTVGSQTVTISGGTLAPGSGKELIIEQFDTGGTLAISSSINLVTGGALTISGGGKVLLSGANVFAGTTTTYINQGTVEVGNSAAFGTAGTGIANNIVLSGGAIFDLFGKSTTITSIHDDPNNVMNGSLLAANGTTDAITNSATGTISTLTLLSNTANTFSYITGGTTEASGAILSLTIGSNTLLDIGGAQDITSSSPSYVPGAVGAASLPYNASFNDDYDLITGAINIQSGGALVTTGSNLNIPFDVMTLGVLNVAAGGDISTSKYVAGTVSASYLSGAGTIDGKILGNAVGPLGLYINPIGSAPDRFTGSITAGVALLVDGTGNLTLTQALSNTQADRFAGTTTTVTPSIASQFTTSGLPTIELTGTSGTILSGGNSTLGSGTLWINPANVSSAVTVDGLTTANSTLSVVNSGGKLLISADGNTSVDFLLGSGSSEAITQTVYQVSLFTRGNGSSFNQGSLIIEAGDGLANLGQGTAKEKVNFNVAPSSLPVNTNGLVLPWIVGQDTDLNQSGSFLQYVGTSGTSADAGFEAYAPTTSSITGATSTSTVDIQTAQTVGYTAATNQTIYSLEVDNNNISTDIGGTISADSGTTTTGSLTFTATGTNNYNLAVGGIILNGGSISGNHLQIAANTAVGGSNTGGTYQNPIYVYTSLAGGNITAPGGWGIGFTAIDGPGVLTFGAGTIFSTPEFYLQNGVLDESNLTAVPTQVIYFEGGILELNGAVLSGGTYQPNFGQGTTSPGSVSWYTGTGPGGGFAARGTGGAGTGNLNIALTGTANIGTPLVWGTTGETGSFLTDGAVLMFGATNANSIVNFENSINLGQSGGSNYYFDVVHLTAASNDGTDPFAVKDPAVLSGVISSSDSFNGLATSGNGVLVLSNASNSYSGATSIGGTSSLLINNDGDLGAPPTAGYALNSDAATSGIAGGAITPGAVVINGGATLGIYYAEVGSTPGTFATTTGSVTLSPYRTILLASGSTGATPSNIDVQTGTTATFNGLVGDYVGEVGALRKTGLGTLNLGGANSYSGGTTVSAGRLNANATSGSSTGSGSVTVANNATLGGTGIIQPGTGNGGAALLAGAILAPGSYSGSTVTGHMTLDNTAANSTILSAVSGSTLVFSLGAGETGVARAGLSLLNTDSTYLNILGNTAQELNFSLSGVTVEVDDLTLGTGLDFNNEAYLLIQAGSNADYLGITTTGGSSGGVALNGFVKNLTTDGTAFDDYAGAQLYLDNGDLELVVAPEPRGVVLLGGGIGLLVIIRRVRRQAPWSSSSHE